MKIANLSGAVAGLCPVTEANLGDGTFNAASYFAAGGRFGVGSDSNVEIGVADARRVGFGIGAEAARLAAKVAKSE